MEMGQNVLNICSFAILSIFFPSPSCSCFVLLQSVAQMDTKIANAERPALLCITGLKLKGQTA